MSKTNITVFKSNQNLLTTHHIKIIMKRVIFLAAVIFLTTNVRAQLTKQKSSKVVTVGEVISPYDLVSLNYMEGESDTTYLIYFRNKKYQSINDVQFIEFKSVAGTVDQLYSLLIDILTDKTKKTGHKETITLGETLIIMTKEKSMNTNYITLYCEKGYFTLTKKQIDKVFGR